MHSRRPNQFKRRTPHVCGSPAACRSSLDGFSLIELLLAIAVLGILSSLAYASYADYIKKAKISTAISDISGIHLAIETYRGINGYLPEDLADLGMDSLEDPWDNPYVFTNFEYINGNGKKRKNRNLVPINSEYDIYSEGEDGKSSSPLTAKISQDDIVFADNGEFIGLAEEY